MSAPMIAAALGDARLGRAWRWSRFAETCCLRRHEEAAARDRSDAARRLRGKRTRCEQAGAEAP
jgi:hypothetical protein